jgi:CubicO group peptidase (beta-lactamase class C family)
VHALDLAGERVARAFARRVAAEVCSVNIKTPRGSAMGGHAVMFRSSALLPLLLALVACGGGDSPSAPTTPTPPPTPTVVSVTVTAPATLTVGGTATATATVQVTNGASTAVTWSSSNEVVASVSSAGLITALSPGAVTIRATSATTPTISGSASITVSPIPVAVTLARTAASDSLYAGTVAGRPDSVSLAISGTGAASLAWTVSKAKAWTTLGTTAGTGTGVVRWGRTAAGLSPGVYVDTITITGAGLATPARLVDTLLVRPSLYADMPMTGIPVAALAGFDQRIPAVMRQFGIPGATLAVVKDGRLVLARGYGWADSVARRQVQLEDRFRIASVSKPVTAVATMRLVEQGRLSLDAPAFALLPDLPAPAGTSPDPRLASVTVRDLLQHSGGWNSGVSGDPQFQNIQIAAALGITGPASASDIIRYMRGRPLDFTPGTGYAYSNFGYNVLGRIIERVSGQPYEAYVRSVLAPAGITRMVLGRSRPGDRMADEPVYYDRFSTTSVFPGGGPVRSPDGGFSVEAFDAHGGWIASAVDLARFTTTSLDAMLARPALGTWTGAAAFYALGLLHRPSPGNWWHDGSMAGTQAWLARYNGGAIVALIFNARDVTGAGFSQQVDPQVGSALTSVMAWPTNNLFPLFR